jgi:hypothetical protein
MLRLHTTSSHNAAQLLSHIRTTTNILPRCSRAIISRVALYSLVFPRIWSYSFAFGPKTKKRNTLSFFICFLLFLGFVRKGTLVATCLSNVLSANGQKRPSISFCRWWWWCSPRSKAALSTSQTQLEGTRTMRRWMLLPLIGLANDIVRSNNLCRT